MNTGVYYLLILLTTSCKSKLQEQKDPVQLVNHTIPEKEEAGTQSPSNNNESGIDYTSHRDLLYILTILPDRPMPTWQ